MTTDRSDDDKLRIVEESFIGHRQATATARRHGICRSLLTTWRRQYRNGELGSSRPVSFAPVTVTKAPTPQANSMDPCPPPDCQVEIALPNGRRLIVPVGVEPEALEMQPYEVKVIDVAGSTEAMPRLAIRIEHR